MRLDPLPGVGWLGFIEGAEYLVSFGVMGLFVLLLGTAAVLKSRLSPDGRGDSTERGDPASPPRARGDAAPSDLAPETDARLRELRAAIAQADAKIAELRSLTGTDAPAQSGAKTPEGKTEAEIIRLAEGGAEPVEIARHLGRGVGEVELVLHLHRACSAGSPQTQAE